ncbi:acyltransferase family protein [Pseudoclavibacter soli]|uniref:acyltransferase family protein n=1 Tax=Pseudoclavibacter soli TaxID=452623 RepID=UPI0004047968|nr:acyltransferase family protein [Pseudoclavibacter soli]
MSSPKYRNDIQGLRALAALLVAVYHIWFHRVSGAVDLFFFISAYFMTTSLLRRLPSGGWATTVRFWKGLAKRLLPQAWAVLLVVAGVSYVITPMTWWRQMLQEVTASATFTVNWVLAANGTDYLHAGDVVSPVQHYWAMAVQMQMYLVWPLVLWLAAAVGQRIHAKITTSIGTVLGLLLVASLAYSVITTATNQPVAYFDTFARAWEFAAGGLFAILLPHLRPSRLLRVTAGWVGVIGLLGFGMVFDVSNSFPGAIAAVPLAFAALIFIAGTDGKDGLDAVADRFGVGRWLSSRPLTWLGGISYGIYLWHWPIMTLWLARNGAEQLSFTQGLFAIELSILLAWGTTRFVEQPIRASTAVRPSAGAVATRKQAHQKLPWRQRAHPVLRLSALATVLALALGSWYANVYRLTARAASTSNPGAAVLAADYDGPLLFSKFTPSFAALDKQWPQWSPTDCREVDTYGEDVRVCEYTPADDVTPDTAQSPRVMVVGSSHTDTWTTLLYRLAVQQGFNLQVIVGPGCDLWANDAEQPDLLGTTQDYCEAQNQVAWDMIQTEPPSVLFTTGNRSVPDSPETLFDARFITRAQQVTVANVPVIALRDNPRFGVSPSTCLAAETDSEHAVENCSIPRDQVLDSRSLAELLPSELQEDPLVIPLDLSDLFCSDMVCPPAIGGVLVYLDGNHPTREYVETMAPQFDERFMAAFRQALGEDGALEAQSVQSES